MTLDLYLKDLEHGVSPFKIGSLTEILNNCSQAVSRNVEKFKNYRKYESRNYENGAYDLFKEYDKNFIAKVGVGVIRE